LEDAAGAPTAFEELLAGGLRQVLGPSHLDHPAP